MMSRLSIFTSLDYRHCRILTVVWMAVIFAMSAQSTVPLPQAVWGQDKFMHFVAYAILGYLLARSIKNSNTGLGLSQVLWVAMIALAYGVSDEFHQSFVVGRDASIGDLLADGLGGLAGALLLLRRKNKSSY